MAEQIQYRPAEARQFRGETEREFERLEGRLAEINGLLDELYASGIIRWLRDFAGAMPQVSTILAESMNTEQGHAGMRNLALIAQQLGHIDPDRLQRTLAAAEAGVEKAGQPAAQDNAYNPPGVTGVFKLLHDKELWETLAPVIDGVKAFSAARTSDNSDSADTDGSR